VDVLDDSEKKLGELPPDKTERKSPPIPGLASPDSSEAGKNSDA